MEELRVRGNALFSSDPRAAANLYQEALGVYEKLKDKSGALEEYTKCAGNALTCLFKVQEYDACLTLAEKVLQCNPLIAKAYAVIGRCLLLRPAFTLPLHGDPLQYLCRAVHLSPSMCETIIPFMDEALERLLHECETLHDEEPCIEVQQGECGRCVVAASHLPPLLVVSSTLHPFSVCSYEETGSVGLCAHCGVVFMPDDGEEPTAALRTCRRCQFVSYCSDRCASCHGRQHEEYECRLLFRLREMLGSMRSCEAAVPDDFFTMATHCITTMSGVKMRKEGHEAVLRLESHEVEVSQGLTPLVRLVQDLFSGEDPTFVTRILGVVRCNALAVCDASGLPVGQALHAASVTSYFNHSCLPNCAIEAGAIVTTRAIRPGEELTISYLPQLYWPAWLRREELAERYFFDCRCVRCDDGDRSPFESALSATLRLGGSREKEREYISSVQILCGRVRAKDVGDVDVGDRDALLHLLQECRQHLFPFHYLCHELHNTLSFVYAVLGDTRACLCSCLRELVMWEAIVPGAHPVKRRKVQNALRCCADEVADKSDTVKNGPSSNSKNDTHEESLLPLRSLLMKFATLYDVAC
ncbi:hypothetical protein C3747_50g160 [Trypanosoma cruzi]|uniref:SET domain-containing protein n=2 Tax=Trypanosoma cruzi TaxID=5693 RepID=Q4DMW0_TRYCC|nr:hypothetical protein, conserved [Trypanosoma cruzi]EAN93861.1 hypothetical protein, conserved [Trypanosoma cruzi]PWV12602.1 hypothetical protein C3747_50g160 [Trypanosoma cruzi]RNC48585.1 hypothetical protein TcCL_NonESM01435 [Trypanosoma cruzi]|eukprot:XP_815712.1 hypothetical protein [Trypanosoma cruzi strain CL Brener]